MVEHAAVGHKVLFNRECKSHKAKVNRRVGGSKPSSGAIFIRCQQAHDAEERVDNCKCQCRGE